MLKLFAALGAETPAGRRKKSKPRQSMKTICLTITIEPDPKTRFRKDREFLRRELEAFAQKLFACYTDGPVPSVKITDALQPEPSDLGEAWRDLI